MLHVEILAIAAISTLQHRTGFVLTDASGTTAGILPRDKVLTRAASDSEDLNWAIFFSASEFLGTTAIICLDVQFFARRASSGLYGRTEVVLTKRFLAAAFIGGIHQCLTIITGGNLLL